MNEELIIVGAGLAGLFAANLALDEGLSVRVVARGRGGLALSHGCIDIYNGSSPSRAIRKLEGSHPYRLVPNRNFKSSMRAFKDILHQCGITYLGGISTSIPLLSPSGTPFRTSFVPKSMFKGRLDDPRPITIVGIECFRDFQVTSLAANAKRHGVPIHAVIKLPMLEVVDHRDLYATDFADLLSDQSTREEIWRAWKPKLSGQSRVGFPAVFGKASAETLIEEAEDFLGLEIFEIPTLPPSLPGVRLESALRMRLIKKGGFLIEGSSVKGRVDGRSKGRLSAGVQLETAGGMRTLDSAYVLLASGGFLNGGLETTYDGRVYEGVYGIPISTNVSQSSWTSTDFWKPQPYSLMGVSTDKLLRPLDQRNKPFLENLFAAGGILSGADRTFEGSRQGIDLSTAYHAVRSILSMAS